MYCEESAGADEASLELRLNVKFTVVRLSKHLVNFTLLR